MGLFKKESKRDAPAEDANGEDKGDDKSMGSKISTFVKQGLTRGKKEAVEATRDLSHTVGLGHKPNQVPRGQADINGEPRTIELGWHPVAGATGKWFAEQTIIGKQITERIGRYPDPTQHWGVIVGDYVHQLWMDESLDVIYFNEKFDREQWQTFEVGKTRFNDQALRKAAQMTIHNMREKRPAYNLISNNCQNFATNLLDKVQLGAHREFATAFSVYSAATGDGEIKDLWTDKHPEEQAQEMDADEEEMPKPKRQNTVMKAEQIMDENTPKLSDQDDKD